MINSTYLIFIILGVALQSVVKKPYTLKTDGKGTYFFNAILSLSAMLFFIVTAKNTTFNTAYVPYSIGFALAYSTTSVSTVCAIATGSLSLTSLFISYSLLLPTFYGLIFLGDKVSIFFAPAIILLVTSLFLINKRSDKKQINPKWIFYVVLATVGNGFCSVIQKMQQIAFSGDYKNEFMIAALAMSGVIMTIISITTERKHIKQFARAGWHFAIICGIINGAVNLFVMILSGRMPVAIMFPLISAGGLVLTYLMSKYLYSEKLSKSQLYGFILGICAIILFNI